MIKNGISFAFTFSFCSRPKLIIQSTKCVLPALLCAAIFINDLNVRIEMDVFEQNSSTIKSDSKNISFKNHSTHDVPQLMMHEWFCPSQKRYTKIWSQPIDESLSCCFASKCSFDTRWPKLNRKCWIRFDFFSLLLLVGIQMKMENILKKIIRNSEWCFPTSLSW